MHGSDAFDGQESAVGVEAASGDVPSSLRRENDGRIRDFLRTPDGTRGVGTLDTLDEALTLIDAHRFEIAPQHGCVDRSRHDSC